MTNSNHVQTSQASLMETSCFTEGQDCKYDLVDCWGPKQVWHVVCFPGKYSIHLCSDSHPIIYTPLQCLITLRVLVKKNTWQNGNRGYNCKGCKRQQIGCYHLPMLGKWISTFKYVWSKGPGCNSWVVLPQNTNSWRGCIWICWIILFHWGKPQIWLPGDCPWQWVISAHDLQECFWVL